MQYAAIPLEVLNSPKFRSLSMPERQFLIDLYVMFIDCETFTVDVKKPEEYRQKPHASLVLKLKSLLNAGFIKVVGRQMTDEYHGRRVFAFVYPAKEIIDTDDEIVEDELNDTIIELNRNYSLRA